MNSIEKKCIGFTCGTLIIASSAMGSKIGVLAMLPISIYALYKPMNETIFYGFIGLYTSSLLYFGSVLMGFMTPKAKK
jgi:hypothetical protein